MSLHEYVLNSSSDTSLLETIELSHPSWSSIHRWVGSSSAGIITGQGIFDPMPVEITRSGTADDLDMSYAIRVGDLGEIIQGEIDRIAADDTWHVKPTAIYRAYRSDNLTSPIIGPVTLDCADWRFDETGLQFTAQSPRINIVATGALYRIERFPMLAGFANDQS